MRSARYWVDSQYLEEQINLQVTILNIPWIFIEYSLSIFLIMLSNKSENAVKTALYVELL